MIDECVKQIRWEGSAAIVELRGEVDMHHTPAVHKALLGVCEKKPPRLVIDMTEVSYLDSSGIGVLVEVFRRVNAYNGQFRLAGVGQRVRSVFEITRLDKFFKMYATTAEALAE
jgi:anti-sigma B factor antagonist